MEREDEGRQDVERMLRRAAELGHDPERVARAVDHHRAPPPATQPVVEVRRRSWLGLRTARLLGRRS